MRKIRKITLSILMILTINLFAINVFADETVSEEATTENLVEGNFLEISDDEQIVENFYEESIHMTDEEALEVYNLYCKTLPKTAKLSQKNIINDLEAFADYAVEQGIIENNAIQRSAITKAVVRAEFKTVVVAGKTAGYKTAALFLEHSLQDKPRDLSYGNTTSLASQILKSSECKKIISDFKNSVKGTNLSARRTSGSTTLNSTTDLHLAYNKVKYIISGKKNNDTWTLDITFSDTYDFEKQSWKNAMTSNPAVTVLNNYAAYAQSLKAIVPFKIRVVVKST